MTDIDRFMRRGVTLLSGLLLLAALWQGMQNRGEFFVTGDQRGQRLMDRGEFLEAAESFSDPFRKAVALSLAGDFKRSAALFSTLPGPEAAFNHGNMLVMTGQYDAAVRRYDRALALRPDWQAPIENRKIALGRAAKLKKEGGNMTGGMLPADEIVFDLSPSSSGTSDDTEENVQGDSLSDSELQAIWLRQVQTTPRDFLRSKFAYQKAMRDKEASDLE